MQTQARMQGGVLTFRSNDGYIVSAPVDAFETHVEDSWSTVEIDALLDSPCIFRDSYSVEFRARLAYGESYTVKDLGIAVHKTFTIKGYYMEMKPERLPALGIPKNANRKYSKKKDETTFFWEERIVVDDG